MVVPGVEEMINLILFMRVSIVMVSRVDEDVSALVLLHRLGESFEDRVDYAAHSLIGADQVKDECCILKGFEGNSSEIFIKVLIVLWRGI